MQSSVHLDQFEQEIINSIEHLLDDEEKNTDFNGKMPQADASKQFQFNLNEMDLNQVYVGDKSHEMRYKRSNNRLSVDPKQLGVSSQQAYIDDYSPIIDAATYTGTQNYIKWSTIESPEIQDPRQKPFIDPNQFVKPVVPSSLTTKPLVLELEKAQFSAPSTPSPYYMTQAITQQVLNQYIYNYNRQLEELKNQSIQQLLNKTGLDPAVLALLGIDYNTVMTNLRHNQMAQQHILNQEMEFAKILNYYNNIRQQKALKAPPKVYCTFCKNSGQP